MARASSPAGGRPSLITRAPRFASSSVQKGPARPRVMSSTVTPASGRGSGGVVIAGTHTRPRSPVRRRLSPDPRAGYRPPVTRACIVGVGETRYARWGGITDRSEHGLALDAIMAAVADAGLAIDDVDGLTSFAGDRNDAVILAADL